MIHLQEKNEQDQPSVGEDEQTKRIDILKKIQEMCQDEDVFIRFERILHDYEAFGTIDSDSEEQ